MAKRVDFSTAVPQLLLTRQEAADLLRVGPGTIDRWANEGKITRLQIQLPGNSQYFPRFLTEELVALIQPWTPGEFGRGGLAKNPNSK